MKEKLEELKKKLEYLNSNVEDAINERNEAIELFKTQIAKEKDPQELVLLLLTAADSISRENTEAERAVGKFRIMKATLALLEK